MELRYLKPEELIGKYVIIDGRKIDKITRITKSYFGVSQSTDLFEFKTGRMRGGSGWHNKWAYLISEEDAAKRIKEWKDKREKREMIDSISNILSKENVSHAQLTEIIEILSN